MDSHGRPWKPMDVHGSPWNTMAGTDCTTIEVPIVLRDLIARERLHARQPYYEIIEEAVLYWLEMGGWGGLRIPLDEADLMPRPRFG